MKKLIGLVGSASLLATAAFAQQSPIYTYDTTTGWSSFPLVVNDNRKVFIMGDKSCMRGPIIIYDHNEREAFKLEADVWYPPNCKDNPDAWKK